MTHSIDNDVRAATEHIKSLCGSMSKDYLKQLLDDIERTLTSSRYKPENIAACRIAQALEHLPVGSALKAVADARAILLPKRQPIKLHHIRDVTATPMILRAASWNNWHRIKLLKVRP
ncbi:MAG: hypothetical protein GC185_01705 [Alphaproteobacteria bacterium]|nr:hypothetical protein [Alphaproteobacteria bacterium]